VTFYEGRERDCWDISQGTEKDAGLWAIAAGLYALAQAHRDAARHLGNGDAATHMGAIEAFGKHIGERLDHLADVISDK
jgi:hypothetical protein